MNIIKRIGLYDIIQSMHKFNICIGVGTGGAGGALALPDSQVGGRGALPPSQEL